MKAIATYWAVVGRQVWCPGHDRCRRAPSCEPSQAAAEVEQMGLSVVVACHDVAEFLPACLDSLIAQELALR